MKKSLIAISLLFAIATQCIAQKFIDVYQKGKITGSFFSSDIDSINVVGEDPSSRSINFWRYGNVSNSFIVSSVDSIKVFHSEDEPLVYLGILGFNQNVYTKPFDILAGSTSNIYSNFVNNLERKDGTLLYYGVDCALDMLSQYNFITPLTSVNLITFTDGLDQGSLMMSTDYQNEEEYLSYLNQRISSTCVRGLPLTAYCLGVRRNDVTDYSQFKNNLRKLATSDDEAIEVSNMSDVQSSLKRIADQIISISNRQTIRLKIPGQSNGTRVRFTFDGESPESSSMYIDGIFNLADRSLSNVTYVGIKSQSGNTAIGIQEGIFVTYTFLGLQRTDCNGLIPINNIRQYNLAKGSTTWQINSEFKPGNNTQTIVNHSGAAIMLVLDCSSSLGSQFINIKNYANEFLSHVASNAANFNITAPTNVTASTDDNMKVFVNWDAVKYAEYYRVYRSMNLDKDYTMVADSLTSTSWCDEQPIKGNNYYKIYAIGHGLTSYASLPSNDIYLGKAIGSGTAEDPWNAEAANEFVSKLAADSPTSEEYYIKGKIASIKEAFTSNYGNASFYISDDGSSENTFYVFRTLYLGNKKWTDGDTQIKVGDEVVIRGKLVNYRGNSPQTQQNESFVFYINGNGGDNPTPDVGVTGSYSNPYSVTSAIAAGSGTGVYVKGYVVGYVSGQVLTEGSHFTAYGCDVKTNILVAASASETDLSKCMPVQLPNGAVRTGVNLQDNPGNFGKEILLYGNIEKYFGATGIKAVSYAEINGNSIGSKP